MKHLIKNNRGDTIIEVLLSIVIISLVLTGAYVSSNSSLLNILAAQQRVEALGIIQGQIEDLRTEASTVFTVNPGYLTHDFCFGINSMGKIAIQNAPCVIQNNYNVTIKNTGETDPTATPPINTNQFTFKVTWQSVEPNADLNSSIGGKDQMIMYYRVTI